MVLGCQSKVKLGRSHANVVKVFENESPSSSGKKVISVRSGVTPLAKRANVTATSQSRSRRPLSHDRENDDQALLIVSERSMLC